MYLHRPLRATEVARENAGNLSPLLARNHVWKFAAAALAALLFLSGSAPPATAEVPSAVEIDGDAVRVGDDVFAGDGCARAGSVTVGNCDEGSKDRESDAPAKDSGADETTAPETTMSEATDQDTTGAEPTDAGATTPSGGDESDIDPEAACPTAPPDDAVPATVGRAVDGDTVELEKPVDGYERVRLISVNTPELKGDSGPEPKAEKASRFTADALEDHEVALETDEEIEDPYGRLLAYVWIVPDSGVPELFNRTLLEEGLAEVMTVKPNDAYADCLADTAKQSGQKDSGTEKNRQTPGTDDEGVLGKIRNLLSPDEDPEKPSETTGEASAPDEQYTDDGSKEGSESDTPENDSTTESPQPSEEANDSSEPPAESSDDGVEETLDETTAPGERTTEKAAETQYKDNQETTTVADNPTDYGVVDLVAAPPEDCPDAAVVLDPYTGDGAAESDPFETTGGSFVVRSNLKGDGGEPLNVSVLDAKTRGPVTDFDQKNQGSYDTRLDVGPGGYRLKSEPADDASKVSYEVAVFDCAGDEPPEATRAEKPEPTVPEGSPADSGTRLQLGSSAPPMSETTGQADPHYAEVGSPEAKSPIGALPVEDSPSGPVPVLPDTGGPAASPGLLAGLVALALGAAGFVGRWRTRRPGSDRW